MKYKGIELVEVTELQDFTSPREMLVWNDNNVNPTKKFVGYAFVEDNRLRFLTVSASIYDHCAEIPKLKSVTYRELARWLAEGNGEFRFARTRFTIFHYLNYQLDDANKPIPESLVVRKWDDIDWESPTREYLGLEDK